MLSRVCVCVILKSNKKNQSSPPPIYKNINILADQSYFYTHTRIFTFLIKKNINQ